MTRPTSKRDLMPITADFIDALREAFGAHSINAQIKAGMAGQPTFYASEGGHSIGTPMGEPVFSVSGDDLVPFKAEVR